MEKTFTDEAVEAVAYRFAETSRYVMMHTQALTFFATVHNAITSLRAHRKGIMTNYDLEAELERFKSVDELINENVNEEFENALADIRQKVSEGVREGILQLESTDRKTPFDIEEYTKLSLEAYTRADSRLIAEMYEVREIFTSLYREFLESGFPGASNVKKVVYDLENMAVTGNA